MKKCSNCNRTKRLTSFTKKEGSKDGHSPRCRLCRNRIAKQRRQTDPVQFLLKMARKRAKKKGLKFNITKEDFPTIPTHCPILGIKLKVNENRWERDSMTIDRINPKKGYVKGNCRIISHRANMLKNNANLKELQAIYEDSLNIHTKKRKE